MKACVVGAGPAGIVSAKVLLENGFNVTVFDKYQRVGGIWSPGGCYDGLHNQSTRRLFEFADLPNRLHLASAVDTQRYLENYAETFGVLDRLRPATEVISIRPVEGPGRMGACGWLIDSRDAENTAAPVQSESFDYVVVASGAHHHVHLPELPGRELFSGTVLHSNEVRAGMFAGRRVAVVGGGKSAMDLITRAAHEASAATIVQRTVNWMIPERLLLGLVGYKWILLSRLGEALLPRYHDPACIRPIDRVDERVKRALWWLITRDMLITTGLYRLPRQLRPAHALPFHLAHTGVMPRGYARAVRCGLIDPKISTVREYTDKGLRLMTGEEVAHWLAGYFEAALRSNPTEQEMQDAIDARLAWQEQVLPGSRGYDFGPYDIHCADELLHDMGLPSHRAGNLLAEYLLPGGVAHRYTGLTAERRGTT